MEGNESGLNSYYHQQHHHHQHQNHHHSATDAAASAAAANGIFPNTHHQNASSGQYSSSEGTTLVFPPHSVTGRAPTASASSQPEIVRRKRGRPRKYATPEAPLNASASAPRIKVSASASSLSHTKKEQSSSSSSSKKSQLVALGNAGQGFTPHVITVAAGEDVAQKIMSFMQQGKRAVCILSASGSISQASLRQPATLGGTVTYEGRFEILSLSGSFLHNEIEGASSRTAGLSVCLSATDGRIVGGGAVGPLKAAGPVQVIAGSFVINTKKDVSVGSKVDASANKSPSPVVGVSVSSAGFRWAADSFGRTPLMENDDHQSIGENHFMLQPRGMHVMPSRSTDWRGGTYAGNCDNIEFTGRKDSGACQEDEPVGD